MEPHVRIAERLGILAQLPLPMFKDLADVSIPMLRQAVKAFVEQDAKLARETMEDEEKADSLRAEIEADMVATVETNSKKDKK